MHFTGRFSKVALKLLALIFAIGLCVCVCLRVPSVSPVRATGVYGTGEVNWRMRGFDAQNTYTNPYEHILNTQNVAKLAPTWSAATGYSTYDSPVVANGIVYTVGGDGFLYAFDVTTGKQLWKDKIYIPGYAYSSPAVAFGLVYVGLKGKFFAFNAQTGAKVWSAMIDGVIEASPTVVDGVVYIGNEADKGKLYAFNALSGQRLWVVDTGGGIGTFAPAVSNGLVYINTYGGTVEAFIARTGERLWFTNVGGGSDNSATAIVNGTLYVGGGPGLAALNARTGVVLWSISLYGAGNASPTVSNGIVYYGANIMYAVNAKTGAVIWSSKNGGQFSTAVLANGVLYAASSSDDSLYAFDAATGATLWSYNIGYANSIYAAPAVVNGVVYTDTLNGTFFVFQLSGN